MTSSGSNRSDVDNHNNNPSTKLTPKQQEAVLFWPLIAHIPIIPCDSQSKQVHVKEWQKMNLDKVDYKQNLQMGLYDNGIAIRLGAALNNTTTIDEENSSITKLYCIALDFDKWEGIVAWFGDLDTWDHVVESSKKTRIEWHGNKEKIHYIFLAQRPIANKKITKLGIEVRCENNLLFCSPSIHEDGNQYVPLGTDKIASLDESQLQRLEVQIDTLCSNYISDENRQAYIRWLEDPRTKLGEGEGRHPALVILGTSYFYRYSGEWRGMIDDQRKAKLWEWNLAHCNPPKFEREFNQIWEWILKYHRKTRDQLHEKLEDEAKADNNTNDCAVYDPYVATELQGNVFYEINEKPPKFIIANNQNKKLIEAKIQTRDTRIMVSGQEQCVKFECLVHLRTYLTCIPIKITRHKNPLAFLDSATKYTMSFVDATGEHTTFKHKTLSEILAGLRDRGYVLSNDGSEGALGAMIQAYKERKIIEDNQTS